MGFAELGDHGLVGWHQQGLGLFVEALPYQAAADADEIDERKISDAGDSR